MNLKAWTDRRIRLGLNAGLVLVCCALLVLVVFAWNSEPGLPERPQSVSAGSAQSVSWRWFDVGVGSELVEAPEEAEEANINATLVGVAIAPGHSYATLRVGRNPEKVFRAGEELVAGAEITAIEPYRILLRQNGRTVQISMAKTSDSTNVISRTRAPVNQPRQGFSVTNMFAAVPVEVEDYETGLQLDSLSEELKTMGDIMDGDVVVQVDGKSVQELLGNPALMMEYSTSSAVPVTVLRDGQEVVVYVNALGVAARLLPELGGGNTP